MTTALDRTRALLNQPPAVPIPGQLDLSTVHADRTHLENLMTARPANFAEAMARPVDRGIFLDSLEIQLTGGCGLCDTEPIQLCAACGLCRCETHKHCIRPTPPAEPTHLEHPMTDTYTHLTDTGDCIEIKPSRGSITVCLEDSTTSMAWVPVSAHLVPALAEALAAANAASDANGAPFPGYVHDDRDGARLAVTAGPGLTVTLTVTEEGEEPVAVAVSTYDVADLIGAITAATA